MNFLSFGEIVMLVTCAHDEAHNNIDNKNMLIRLRTNIIYAFTFSSCASSVSNSRRLGLISRGLPT